LKKYSLVKLTTGTKRKIKEIVKGFPINLNGVSTNVDMNIIPLGSCDILIGMDWLDKHHFLVLQDFEDVFQEIIGFPPKREIYFSIDLVPGVSLVSKTPYRMSTLQLTELQM
jgi:hypothetical protein